MRTQRIRDAVHGLIVFDQDDPIDVLAWKLIDTPEFQRLRRIKQLGVSEFVFPGAVHTRFAHCIGVFHVARKLLDVIDREIWEIEEEFNESRAEVAVIAALLHDLGHGPFSHTFEGVQKARGVKKRHEKWTADIIRNPEGHIAPLLEGHRSGFCSEVSSLLEAEDPVDIYHAIVSSSFDADRLDYLQRDRLMTGTKAGAIDLDWLMEHVRVRVVNLEAVAGFEDDDDESAMAPTFCIDEKALPAAEQFLLARYTLHEQVYFHKTTRCIEHMISKLLRLVADCAADRRKCAARTGLQSTHPLIRFFSASGETLENYLALDDVVVLGAIERMTSAEDPEVAELARRLRDRNLYKTLDIRSFGADAGRQRSSARKIDQLLVDAIKTQRVLKDEGAAISIYTQVGGDDEKAHKKLRILDGAGKAREVTDPNVSALVATLAQKRVLTRYYFSNDSDRQMARQCHGERK